MSEQGSVRESSEGAAFSEGVPGGEKGFVSFLVRRRAALLRALGLLLLLIVLLQNVEPIRFQILFWSLPSVPKIALILVSMALGAALWELARRAWRRSRRRR